MNILFRFARIVLATELRLCRAPRGAVCKKQWLAGAFEFFSVDSGVGSWRIALSEMNFSYSPALFKLILSQRTHARLVSSLHDLGELLWTQSKVFS